jgi:3-hydroxyisobutyrate dehydrogenase
MSAATPHTRVALIGLGIMGGGMARRLIGAGFRVSVYNRTTNKADALVADGAYLAGSPREAASRAEVVVSMLADDTASRGVWLGAHGALAGTARGTVLIECSTLSPGWIGELAAAASRQGCELLDAPVTGSRTHAANGELNFLVGGSAAALETARPVLAAMSKSIVHIGPTGSGALLKLINNFLCGVQAASLGEALALIEASGLDRAKALEILTNGAPGSPLVKTLSARMTARDYTPNFLLALMAKDLVYAVAQGGEAGVPLTTARTALDLFARAVADGHGDKDFSAVSEAVRKRPDARGQR